MGRLTRLGVLVLLFAASADVAYHALPGLPLALVGPNGAYPHVAMLAGMLLALAGVLHTGLRPPTHHSEVRTHAHR